MKCTRCGDSYSQGAMWSPDETSISLPGVVCHGCYEVIRKNKRNHRQQQKGAEIANKRQAEQGNENGEN